MISNEPVDILRQGASIWNNWRSEKYDERLVSGRNGLNLAQVNLDGCNLCGVNLSGVRLSAAHIRRADLTGAILSNADLTYADFRGSVLSGANLRRANLSDACLSETKLNDCAFLDEAILSRCDLSKADLSNALMMRTDLQGALMCGAKLEGTCLEDSRLNHANLSGALLKSCRVYGISAWDVKLTGACQESLVITPGGGPLVTVDDLTVAQFLYMMLSNTHIQKIVDHVSGKLVLILGRFSRNHKRVLDMLRTVLPNHGYVPVMYDFEKPQNRNDTETVLLLASISRFVIADISEPRCVPQELQAIVPHHPSLPVLPILHQSFTEYGMFRDFYRYPWVCKLLSYTDEEDLKAKLYSGIIERAEAKLQELRQF